MNTLYFSAAKALMALIVIVATGCVATRSYRVNLNPDQRFLEELVLREFIHRHVPHATEKDAPLEVLFVHGSNETEQKMVAEFKTANIPVLPHKRHRVSAKRGVVDSLTGCSGLVLSASEVYIGLIPPQIVRNVNKVPEGTDAVVVCTRYGGYLALTTEYCFLHLDRGQWKILSWVESRLSV